MKYKFPYARFLLSLLGILIIMSVWTWSVLYLYSMPEHAIAAYQAITVNTQYAVCVIVVFAVTGKLVWDWKNQSASEAITKAEHIVEERITHAAKPEAFDNGSI